MPRESRPLGGSRGEAERAPEPAVPRPDAALPLTPELREALLPWVDIAEVGPVGLHSWILSILPLLPSPSEGDHVLDRDVSRGDLTVRLERLAHALADCASDRARKNFQASEYFRENRVLARRLKALEAMLRTRMATGQMERIDITDPASAAAAQRYLPPKPS